MSTIPVRSSSSARVDGLRRLAHTLRRGELVWLVNATYDDYAQLWLFDLLRQGAKGTWVIQRFAYDLHNDIQHYRGEMAVPDSQVRATRAKAKPFDIADWQDGATE
jgi:hypothetical protein